MNVATFAALVPPVRLGMLVTLLLRDRTRKSVIAPLASQPKPVLKKSVEPMVFWVISTHAVTAAVEPVLTRIALPAALPPTPGTLPGWSIVLIPIFTATVPPLDVILIPCPPI